MEIIEEFRVPLPVDDAWLLLLDVERIAPCMPGAQLQEVEGDEYRGVVKVKVGPITAQYKGTARLESTDDATHTAVIVASGRDTRGQGNASATVQLALRPDGDGTLVSVETELAITGKVAQFGRGVLGDVSTKLLGQFVENLERDVLGAEPTGESGAPAPGPSPPPEPAPVATPNGSSPTPVREIRRIDGPEPAPVDLLAVSRQSVGKRLIPIGVLALVLLILLRVRHKRRRAS
jgi:carbon monoxide dehydrogenase subunit G